MNKHEKNADENVFENEDEVETTEDACDCSNCGCSTEEISIKDIAYHADDKIDALIQLLIKKKIISEHEFEEEYNSLFEEEE